MSRRGSTRGFWLESAQRVTAKPPNTSRPNSTGENGAATTSGGAAGTDHRIQSQTQAVLSTATAGGSRRGSTQFERFKFGPVLGDEVNRYLLGQGHLGHSARLRHHHQGHRVAGG